MFAHILWWRAGRISPLLLRISGLRRLELECQARVGRALGLALLVLVLVGAVVCRVAALVLLLRLRLRSGSETLRGKIRKIRLWQGLLGLVDVRLLETGERGGGLEGGLEFVGLELSLG